MSSFWDFKVGDEVIIIYPPSRWFMAECTIVATYAPYTATLNGKINTGTVYVVDIEPTNPDWKVGFYAHHLVPKKPGVTVSDSEEVTREILNSKSLL